MADNEDHEQVLHDMAKAMRRMERRLPPEPHPERSI
jgi:hypothetical protein